MSSPPRPASPSGLARKVTSAGQATPLPARGVAVSSPGRLLPPWQGTAAAILGAHLWCVIEVCRNVAAPEWEPRLIIFDDSVAGVADAIAAFISDFPGRDVRIAGYTRDHLRRNGRAPTALCHVAAISPGPVREDG
jgi:hypothetical protein